MADKAYAGRKDLRVVVIESGVTEIGARAFDGCTNLGLVFIPKSVAKVGKKAFNRCPNLLVLMESGIAQSVVDEMYQQELQFRVGPTYKAGEQAVRSIHTGSAIRRWEDTGLPTTSVIRLSRKRIRSAKLSQ